MQTDNRFFDDLARIFSSAAGVVQGARDEVESLFQSRLERVLARMDLVSREEFDVAKAMAAEARAQNEALAARVTALEKMLEKGA